MTSFSAIAQSLRETTMTTVDDKHYRAKITKRVDLAPELWVIRIDPGAEFKFIPGQYATLGVEGEGKLCTRTGTKAVSKGNTNSFCSTGPADRGNSGMWKNSSDTLRTLPGSSTYRR